MGLHTSEKRVFSIVQRVGQPRINVLLKLVKRKIDVVLILCQHQTDQQTVGTVKTEQIVYGTVGVEIAVRGWKVFLPPRNRGQVHQCAQCFMDMYQQSLAGELFSFVQLVLREPQIETQCVRVDWLPIWQAVDQRFRFVVPSKHSQCVNAQQARSQLLVFGFALCFALLKQCKTARNQRFALLLGVFRVRQRRGQEVKIKSTEHDFELAAGWVLAQDGLGCLLSGSKALLIKYSAQMVANSAQFFVGGRGVKIEQRIDCHAKGTGDWWQ